MADAACPVRVKAHCRRMPKKRNNAGGGGRKPAAQKAPKPKVAKPKAAKPKAQKIAKPNQDPQRIAELRRRLRDLGINVIGDNYTVEDLQTQLDAMSEIY